VNTPIKYKFITVGINPDFAEWKGKPAYTVINNKSTQELARIIWYPLWRRYIVQFNPNSIWSDDCLADIQDALAKAEG
jgi:hypothetical protein